jgi:hypothetical protein
MKNILDDVTSIELRFELDDTSKDDEIIKLWGIFSDL